MMGTKILDGLMNKLVLSNLLHRPIRSVISIAAVAVEVTLILLIVGLMLGILNDSKERQRGIGADVMVMPPKSSPFIGLSSAPVSEKVADKLRKLAHVAAVAPVVQQISTGGAVEVIYGIDLKEYEELGGPFRYLAGGPFSGPNDVIVDNIFAASKNVRPGDEIEILNQKFRISGVVEHGRGARKFIPKRTLQDLIGARGKASVFYVKTDTPENADLAVREIKAVPGMSQYSVHTLQQWLSLMSAGNVPGFSTTVGVVIGVAVIIGFIVIFQAMYTAILERTREIGILKSLGASKLYIVNVVLRETTLLALGGVIAGIVISYAARGALARRFPTIRVEVYADWVLYAGIIALAGAILGALYPAFKAAQKDPIDALAYE
jgi:putative ABC transport system permease protein